MLVLLKKFATKLTVCNTLQSLNVMLRNYRSQRQLVMNKWYHIKVMRRGRTANLTVDNDVPVTGNSKGPFQMLKLREPLFIGGTNDFSSIPIAAEAHTNFKGCIEKVC